MCAAAWIGRRDGRESGRSYEKAATLSPSLPLGQLCPSVRWRWPRSPLSARLMKTPPPPPPQRPPNEQTGGQLNSALSLARSLSLSTAAASPVLRARPPPFVVVSLLHDDAEGRTAGARGSEGRREGRAGLPSSRSAAEGGWLRTERRTANIEEGCELAAVTRHESPLARPLQSF